MRKIYLSSETKVYVSKNWNNTPVLIIEINGEEYEDICFDVKEKCEEIKQFLSKNERFYFKAAYDWDIMQSLNSDDCVHLL